MTLLSFLMSRQRIIITLHFESMAALHQLTLILRRNTHKILQFYLLSILYFYFLKIFIKKNLLLNYINQI